MEQVILIGALRSAFLILTAIAVGGASACACVTPVSMGPVSAALAAAETLHDSHTAHAGVHYNHDSESAHHKKAPCSGDCGHDDGKTLAGAAVYAGPDAPASGAIKIVTAAGAEAIRTLAYGAFQYAASAWRGPPGDTLVSLKIRLQN